MGSWNYQQEISSEAEDNIIREVFPELLEASELGQETEQESLLGERGRYMGAAPQRRGGRRNSYTSSRGTIRRPAFSARYSRRNTPYRSRNTGWKTGYSGVASNWNTPYAANTGWPQYPMRRWGGQWSGVQTGGIDPDTTRALRIFQSRRRLPATGVLDATTLQTLLTVLNQLTAPPVDNAPPPNTQAPSPAVDSAPPPDDTAPPDDLPDQGDAPPPAATQSEFGDFYPEYKRRFRNDNWRQEYEAPKAPGQGAQLTCRPTIVLDGFRTGDYTIRRQHYAKLLAIPLPVPVIVIRGFTDNQADAASNRGLSLSRAIEVQQWLTLRNGGRPIARNIIVEAFGAALPVAPNGTEAGRSRNRRVEILLCQAPPPPPPPPLIASILRVQMGGNA